MNAVSTVHSAATATRESTTRVGTCARTLVLARERGAHAIEGRFRICSHLRSGGMGEVYLADDRLTGKLVAVKTLSTVHAQVVERFLREATILSELDHPAIVRHIAQGIDQDGPWLVMEWIDGEPLCDRLHRGSVTLAETLALGERIAKALAIVHELGIVHRDVKPSNIVLEGGAVDRAVLIDFGIAHLLEDDDALTRTGELLGTPGYMAPEQALGARIDERADVFALGCVLFRCITGVTPYPKSDARKAAIHLLLDDAPRVSSLVPNIPPALDELVARMLSREKALRPEDAREVANALAAIRRPNLAKPQAHFERPALGRTERRVVSLVLARRPGIEPTLAAIQAMREVLPEPIAEHDATVEVLGDGSILVTATGGTPREAALRAARSALVLHEELPDACIVLCTGHAVLEDTAPVGELVDRALLLLEEVERIGDIRLDTTSADLLASRCEIDGLLLRAERVHEHPRTLLGRPTPFVGRARELAMLDAALAECESEVVARATVITAEPGMGKSRLRNEYVARLRRRRPDIAVWTAACDPVAKGAPLGMVAQLLKDALVLAHGGAIPERRRLLLEAIDALGIPRDRRVAEIVGEILGAAFDDADVSELRLVRHDPQLFATRLRDAVRELMEARASSGGLVVVIEDLHWADLASVKLLESLVSEGEAAPLFVLAFARPEVATAFPSLFGPTTQTIRLLELSRRASIELVERVLGPAADAKVCELVVARAHGNTFFLEELIRAVAEGRDALPATVIATMEARILRLETDARQILRAASIFGEAVSARAVQALVGGNLRAIEETLARLAASELLSKENDLYRFRHAIVREAAYAMLTEDDRKLGHRLAAEWLESDGTHDAIVIAEHYENGGEPRKARFHLHRAAQEALVRSDLETTFALSTRVLDLGATGELHTSARMLQAEATGWLDSRSTPKEGDRGVKLAP